MTEIGSKYLKQLVCAVACGAAMLLGAPSGPADASDAGFFTIRSKLLNDNLTSLQKGSYWDSLKGKKIVWTGRVSNVSNELFGNGVVVGIEMDTRMQSPSDILIVTGRKIGESLRKNQSITFSGVLDDYTNAGFGHVSFSLKRTRIVSVK